MSGKLFSRKVDKAPGENEEGVEGESPGSCDKRGYGGKTEKMVGGKESAKLTKARMKEMKKERKKEAKGERKARSDPEEDSKEGHAILTVQKYHRGFISALLWWIILVPVLFLIPPVGVLFVFIIAPFVAGRRGSRWVEKKYAVELGILAAVVVSLLQIFFLNYFLESFTYETVLPVSYGSTEYLIILFGCICNLGFCLLGAVSGKFKYFQAPETDRA